MENLESRTLIMGDYDALELLKLKSVLKISSTPEFEIEICVLFCFLDWAFSRLSSSGDSKSQACNTTPDRL